MSGDLRSSEIASRGIQSTGATGKTEESMRILYVEDDATSARLVKMIAEKEGYSVALATSEKECWKLVAEDVPGLFLIDLTLPDGSGLDLMARLKEKHPSVPSIV